MAPKITCIECIEFDYPLEDVGVERTEYGGSTIYEPGGQIERNVFAIRVETDVGVRGEYIASHSPPDEALAEINMFADALIGKNPLERERHWAEIKRGLRKYGQMGLGPMDIALWDFEGRYRDAPVHELLGTYRTRLPTYASTYHADPNGGLDSPKAYADFAEECLRIGYPAFKLHGFGEYERDIEAIHAVGNRVGDEMDLMIDPSCKYETFGRALEVGRACDEQKFFWYEDPYQDGGTSQHGHRKLRQFLDTPLLQAEMVRGLEPHTDFIATESTDFVRADPEYDGGITGAMKIARVAEGFGLDVEYHAPCPARRHCMAASRNSNYYELALVHPDCTNPRHVPAYGGDYSEELDAIDSDGTVPVPDGPGLGVPIDWDYIEDRAIRTRVYS